MNTIYEGIKELFNILENTNIKKNMSKLIKEILFTTLLLISK